MFVAWVVFTLIPIRDTVMKMEKVNVQNIERMSLNLLIFKPNNQDSNVIYVNKEVYIMSFKIIIFLKFCLFLADATNHNVWLGLTKENANDPFYWKHSGVYVSDSIGRSDLKWGENEPADTNLCAYMEAYEANNFTLHESACSSTVAQFTVCIIPFVENN